MDWFFLIIIWFFGGLSVFIMIKALEKSFGENLFSFKEIFIASLLWPIMLTSFTLLNFSDFIEDALKH